MKSKNKKRTFLISLVLSLGIFLFCQLAVIQAAATSVYAVADGYAWSGGTENPNGASSTGEKLRVGFRTAAGNYRTLIKFDLSLIPAGATITSADLKLYYHYYSGTAGNPLDVSVYRTTANWNEGGLSWSKAENYNSFPYDTVTIIAGSGDGYKTWDIKSLVQYWVDGTYSNYGVLLRAPTQSGSNIYRQFRSKEYGANVPKLEVTYTTGQDLLPAPQLSSPQNNRQGVSTTPYFDWSFVSGATHYWLMVAENENYLPDDPNAETCPNCVISKPSLISSQYSTPTNLELEEGTTYYWQVQAYEWGGSSVARQGEFSEHYKFTTIAGNLQINADFDSASIGAYNINANEISFALNVDTLNDYTYWTNFKVSDVLNKEITFRITNANEVPFLTETTKEAQLVYSCDGENWNRITSYSYSNPIYTFTQTFPCKEAQIATFFPFSYTKMHNYIDMTSSSQWATQTVLGSSHQGRDIDLLTITNIAIPISEKKIIYIIGRQHSAETASSHMLEGMIDFLISDNADAARMRNNFVWYIVPMVNPDGVYLGKSRETSEGNNANRDWHVNNHNTEEIDIVRADINEKENNHSIDFFIDWHNQMNDIRWYNFIYSPTGNTFFSILSSWTDFDSQQASGASSCTISKCTARGYIMNNILFDPVFVFEPTPHLSSWTVNSLKQQGESIAFAIDEYFQQCTSGPCCDVSTGTFKSSGSQPNGYTDDNNGLCSGSSSFQTSCSNSPIGICYILTKDYYCNGTDADTQVSYTAQDICGTCKYCEDNKLSCTDYSNGTSCGVNKICDGNGHCILPGDANEDCVVNILDLVFIRNKLGQDVNIDDNWKADINGDGKINILDLVTARNNLGKRCENTLSEIIGHFFSFLDHQGLASLFSLFLKD